MSSLVAEAIMFHVQKRFPDAVGIMYVLPYSHLHIRITYQSSNCNVRLFSWSLQEDFLLLCPAHSSVKFPNEKSGHRVSRAEPLPKTYKSFSAYNVDTYGMTLLFL